MVVVSIVPLGEWPVDISFLSKLSLIAYAGAMYTQELTTVTGKSTPDYGEYGTGTYSGTSTSTVPRGLLLGKIVCERDRDMSSLHLL